MERDSRTENALQRKDESRLVQIAMLPPANRYDRYSGLECNYVLLGGDR